MTNEEREALIAQGWTPPVAVDPDIAEAKRLGDYWSHNTEFRPKQIILQAIKRGRELAAAETKPELDWKKYKGCAKPPVSSKTHVCVRYCNMDEYDAGTAEQFDWFTVTHYAVITPPAEDVA